MSDEQDPSVPLFGEMNVQINGQPVKVLRLNIEQLFIFLRIARDVYGRGWTELEMRTKGLRIMEKLNPAQALTSILLLGAAAGEHEVIRLLASLIGWPETDIRNPEKFPLGSELRLLKALPHHPDVKAFFLELEDTSDLTELLNLMIRPASSGASTESQPATAGVTAT